MKKTITILFLLVGFNVYAEFGGRLELGKVTDSNRMDEMSPLYFTVVGVNYTQGLPFGFKLAAATDIKTYIFYGGRVNVWHPIANIYTYSGRFYLNQNMSIKYEHYCNHYTYTAQPNCTIEQNKKIYDKVWGSGAMSEVSFIVEF